MVEYTTPLIIAHRGASIKEHENSIKAFELAVKQKADMIELDAHLTRDGYFVVFHNDTIPYKDNNIVIAESNLETIQKFKLPNGEPIPLLEDVLKQFLSKIKFNIELKCDVTKEQFDSLLNEVGGDNSRILVSSFLHEPIVNLKNSTLGYELAYLYIFPIYQNKSVALNDFIDAMNPFYRFLTKRAVNFYHKQGKKVFPWTINDEKQIRKLVRRNVDGIITDLPKQTREIISSELEKLNS
ncbi:MAG: glycerophosphodiester phosphodiesterase [Candidatus Heimdallarchaeota archaeon]|nr:glycerophosphodiester phosphodiesterase [Candidatus Heimdallarchaeota archaeon]MCG3255736.1 glycerophosphodiester phosphodiesterase [Candidatus Heimdallarchaeota archaeon]MCK4610810.1 glycerophosphodiester phosphodiesterase [Candidatus Heimdallarchaeota archaeon]